MNDLNLVVLGTSVLWGQGLEDADKIHQVLARMMNDKHPDVTVNLTFLAHSGATTGYKPDGEIDTHHQPRIHGEVPTPYPTIVQQIEEFDESGIAPDAVNVVLFEAGINDVSLERILNPFVSPDEIKEQVEIYCRKHLKLLVEQLTTKFKNAKIIIAAYYEFITEESEAGALRMMLKAFDKLPDHFLADMLLKAADEILKNRLILNCDTFVEYSLLAFQETAAITNEMLGNERVFVAKPDFKAENATFAPDAWLFGMNDDLTPQDPLGKIRDLECDEAGILRTNPLICDRASAGHPNPRGAIAYAEAIVAYL